MSIDKLSTEAKLINKYGDEVPIDSEIFEDDLDNSFPRIVAIHNNLELKTKYSLDIYKYTNYEEQECELVDSIPFDKEPTDKEIIYYLAKYELIEYNGFAEVTKRKVLSWKEE